MGEQSVVLNKKISLVYINNLLDKLRIPCFISMSDNPLTLLACYITFVDFSFFLSKVVLLPFASSLTSLTVV